MLPAPAAVGVFMLAALCVGPVAFQTAPRYAAPAILRRSAVTLMGRKPGVSEPEELKAFVAEAGDNIIVVDV